MNKRSFKNTAIARDLREVNHLITRAVLVLDRHLLANEVCALMKFKRTIPVLLRSMDAESLQEENHDDMNHKNPDRISELTEWNESTTKLIEVFEAAGDNESVDELFKVKRDLNRRLTLVERSDTGRANQ